MLIAHSAAWCLPASPAQKNRVVLGCLAWVVGGKVARYLYLLVRLDKHQAGVEKRGLRLERNPTDVVLVQRLAHSVSYVVVEARANDVVLVCECSNYMGGRR